MVNTMNVHSKTYKVGDVTITRVTEQVINLAPEVLLPDWNPAVVQEHQDWLVPGCMDETHEHFILSIHTWVVKTQRHTILIDTASGNDKERPLNPIFHHLQLPYLERLEAAGVTPEAVDYVLLTHLHVDHVGWNTRLVDGRWVPTFPNAKYVFPKVEQDYYSSPASHNDVNIPSLGVYEDSVLPVIEAGLTETISSGGGEFIDGLSFLPTPGHSIGHMSISLTSRGEEALFSGDVMHHPIQVYRPEWNSVFCEFADQARASRLWALEYAAQRGATFFSTHFPKSSAGLVTRKGDQFDWRFI
ncbi:MBL fold metallo-hydrolase [Brasilonema sp. UFV-L1]|uniref:MBL fold metallo-hydrolase n=1 Tax=Brasilonema sp. UFV-L1 TaxID=2234130 RepID=UPI001B7CF1AD|nr:MBL fold metallo-hydrolase [Brasilonema sp. UFV-L1]